MGHSTKPRLDQEDKRLLEYIIKYGFIDMDFINMFYKKSCKERTRYERILQLEKHGYLFSEKTFIPENYILSGHIGYKIITLGKEGLQLMHRLGFVVNDYRKTLKDAPTYRAYHQVQVATVCECIKKQFDTHDVFYVDQIYSEKDSVLDERNNQPDATIIMKRKDNDKMNIAIFVELERSYASKDRIHSKLSNYYTVISDKRYAKHFGISIAAHRVIFVSQTTSQMETIKKKIEESEVHTQLELFVCNYIDACLHATEDVFYQPKMEVPNGLLKKYVISKMGSE